MLARCSGPWRCSLIGILIVVRRELFVDLVVIVVGLYVAYAGASELMRLILPEQEAEAESDRAQGRPGADRRPASPPGVILIAGALFISVGGISEAPGDDRHGRLQRRARSSATGRSNEVAFPSTHNAMSAATNPDWLFAQQDDGLRRPARATGSAACSSTPTTGPPTEGGTVKTDLSDLDSGERADLRGGARLRGARRGAADPRPDRQLAGDRPARRSTSATASASSGRSRSTTAFSRLRDFLAANPDEVLVIVIEDYVEPADIDAAVARDAA